MNRPQNFIQWKGTDVCMDITCSCGDSAHMDTDFLYNWKCLNCGRIWRLGTQVTMTEISAEELGDSIVQSEINT